MSAPAPEPRGWELQRQLTMIMDSLQRIEDRMVPRPEFELYKQETERRFRAVDDRMTTVVDDKSVAHGRLEQQIKDVQAEHDRDAEHRRNLNVKAWSALGVAVVALLADGLRTVLFGG